MPKADFVEQLKKLGHEVEDLGADWVAFPFEIPCGRLAGQQIKLGFVVPGDFPLNPPGGLQVSPQILPLNPQSGSHPNCGVHASPFGAEWEYWSRPMHHWAQTNRAVRDVMAHVRHLFDTL